jgi:hypothetical protein
MRNLFLPALFLLVACNSNPLRTDENKLKRGVLAEESKNRVSENFKRENDSLAVHPQGFRYKPVKAGYMKPVVLDFTGSIPVRKQKLSQIASRVKYVVLEVPDDSTFFAWSARIQFAGDNIIVNNNLGIHRFSSEGKYLEMICRNKVDSPHDRMAFISKETFKGAWIDHVDVAGNTVLYKYTDYPGKKVSLLRYSLSNAPVLFSQTNNSENSPPETFAKGDQVITGPIESSGEKPGLSSSRLHAVSDDFYSGTPGNGPDAFAKDAPLLTVFNNRGDTICIFPQHDHLASPVTMSVVRSFGNLSWFNNEVPTYKWAFNDTVFRLLPPNKLSPAYVFNFGKNRISVDDWLHVNASLKGKMTVTGIIEGAHYLFITWCTYPNDDVRGSIYNKAVYDKSSATLYNPGIPETERKAPPPLGSSPANTEYNPAGMENDIDGGISFWPSLITGNGKLALRTSPELLKSYIKSSFYKNSNAGFSEFVKSLKSGKEQLVLMILE